MGGIKLKGLRKMKARRTVPSDYSITRRTPQLTLGSNYCAKSLTTIEGETIIDPFLQYEGREEVRGNEGARVLHRFALVDDPERRTVKIPAERILGVEMGWNLRLSPKTICALFPYNPTSPTEASR